MKIRMDTFLWDSQKYEKQLPRIGDENQQIPSSLLEVSSPSN
jgi:hypothetical protein